MARNDPCEKCDTPSTDGHLRRGLCKRCDALRRRRIGYESTYVDAEPVRQHVRALQSAGLGLRRITELTGVNRSNLQALLNGKTRQGHRENPSTHVSMHTAERLLMLEIPGHSDLKLVVSSGARVPSVGTFRRVRSLIALGYTQTALAQHIGWTVQHFGNQLVHGKGTTVTAETARKVQAMFDELQLTPGQYERSRTLAQRKKWPVPFAWDEADIDVPLPDAELVHNATASRLMRENFVDTYLELRDFIGLDDTQIAARMGIKYASLLVQKTRYADEMAAMESLEGLAG